MENIKTRAGEYLNFCSLERTERCLYLSCIYQSISHTNTPGAVEAFVSDSLYLLMKANLRNFNVVSSDLSVLIWECGALYCTKSVQFYQIYMCERTDVVTSL